ncbi:MAG TPA: diguanylate cyclase [Chloroflexota bacterium]
MLRNSGPETVGGDEPVTWAFLTGTRVLEAGRASLLVRDDDQPVLVVQASVGIDRDIADGIRVNVGQGIAGMVAERGMLFFGTRGDDTFLSLPVVTDRGVEGVLNLTNRMDGRPYVDADIEPARSVAQHLGRLMEYFRHENADIRAKRPETEASDQPERTGQSDFYDMLERELSRSKRLGNPFAVAFVDVVVHSATSEETHLDEIEKALQRVLRRYDTAVHWDGSRFGLLLAGPGPVNDGVIRRITEAVGESLKRGIDETVAVRVGLAHCPGDGINAQQLLAVANERVRETTQARRLASS